jgi:hypothetical protein
MSRRAALALCPLVALALAAGPLPATPPPPPSGEPVLTVGGAIAQTNAPEGAVFDLATLESLSSVSFTTTTQWTEGEVTFTGVPLRGLLDGLGATGTVVRATALNDYSVEIPYDSLGEDAPIVAYRMNGETFSRREKGPLWIVFPYDRDPAYRTETIFGQSIWQLDRLTVE